MSNGNSNVVKYGLLMVFFTVIISLSTVDTAFAVPSIIDSGIVNYLPSLPVTSTLTIPSVTTGTDANRFLVVGVSIDHSKTTDETITSVVFGPGGPACSLVTGISLGLVSGTTSTSASSYNQIYSLVNPPASEDCDVVVTLTGNVGNISPFGSTTAGANFVLLRGVDQSNPIESSLTVKNTATSTTPSVSIVTGANHFAYDVMSTAGVTVQVPIQDQDTPSQTLVQAFRSVGGINGSPFAMGSSTQPGVSDGIMSWTLTPSATWDISSIAIRDVSLTAIVSTVASDKPGGGCDGDCTPPTLGVDFNGMIFVDDGFVYNDYTTDVNLFYTPFPLITVNVGDENVAELKIYENSGTSNLRHVGLGFGLTHGSIFSHAAATIELDIDWDGTQTVSVFDPENVLENIRIETDIVDCRDTDQSQCTLVKIYHTFRAPLKFNIVSTNVWDKNQNAWQNHYNHGIQIDGDSLNPPKTTLVAFGEKNMRGLFTLTQIDPIVNLWIDDFGSVYSNLGNNRFDRLSQIPVEKVLDLSTSHGCTRTCNWFIDYKYDQQLLAEASFNDLLQYHDITGYLEDSKTIPISHLSRSMNPELQNSITNEKENALDLYEEFYYDNEKPHHNFD